MLVLTVMRNRLKKMRKSTGTWRIIWNRYYGFLFLKIITLIKYTITIIITLLDEKGNARTPAQVTLSLLQVTWRKNQTHQLPSRRTQPFVQSRIRLIAIAISQSQTRSNQTQGKAHWGLQLAQRLKDNAFGGDFQTLLHPYLQNRKTHDFWKIVIWKNSPYVGSTVRFFEGFRTHSSVDWQLNEGSPWKKLNCQGLQKDFVQL